VILGAEIGLMVFAIITLVRGKLVLTKNRVVTGVPARLLALIGFLPLPVTLVLGLAIGVFLVGRGQPVDQTRVRIIGAVVELSVIVLCVAAIYGIGLMIAKPPMPERRRRRRLDEDDEETPPEETPPAPARRASTDIQRGEPPLPSHVTASATRRSAPPPAPEDRPAPKSESNRIARQAGSGGRTWIIVVAAIGALSICCLGVVVVAGGVAWWTLRVQPIAKAPEVHEAPVVEAERPPPPPPKVEPPKAEPPKVEPPKVEPPKVEPPKVEPPRLKLPPIPARAPIPPSQVKTQTTVPLPERPSRITVGGGGRYLWLYYPKRQHLSQLDVVTGKLARNVGAQNDQEIAAGLTRMLTWSPRSNTLARCDVATGAQQRVFSLKLNGKVTAFCMGSASDGPLLVATDKEFKLIDIETGNDLTLPNDQNGQPLTRMSDCSFWPDGTGRVFGRASRAGMPNGVASLVLESDRAVQHYQHQGTFYNVPSPDGRYLFAGGHGVLTIDVKVVPDAAYSNLQSDNARYLYLPAHHGPYYFHLHAGTDPGPGQGGERGIRIYRYGQPKPVQIVPDAGTPTFAEMRAVRDLRLEDTAHLIPEAKLLVVIPKEGDRLLLYPVEL
jgi:hypothetical protein